MKSFLLPALLFVIVSGFAQKPGEALPPWKEGYLDLHHINTGRGDAAIYVLPDGTTFLLDAGEMPPDDSPRRTNPHPNGSNPPYAWIVQYLRKFMPPVSNGNIDYALISHFHNDHFGGVYEGAPKGSGTYVRSGMTGVGDEIRIRTMIDRGYPDYRYPNQLRTLRHSYSEMKDVPAMGRGIVNYWRFLDHHIQNAGMKVESLKAGRDDQITLVHNRKKYPTFRVRNIKSNGTIWTGRGTETFEHFVPYSDTVDISENPLSNAIRIDYGDFRYYSGGDCPGIVDLGQPQWNDVGTHVAKAVGEVDVATLDHHGNRDAHNEFNVRTLRPRVWIGQSWSADHPGHDVLRRITSQYLYKGPRDLFATNMMEANKVVIGPLIERSYKSTEGHIVVRVMPGGAEYYVIILNDENEENEIVSVFGPYQSKRK